MTNPRLLLGVDISTTGAKALLINQNGEVLTSATTPLSLQTPYPLWSEQDPEEWWQGIKTSIQKVLAERDSALESIAAIGLTGQMHGLVMLDESGQVLRVLNKFHWEFNIQPFGKFHVQVYFCLLVGNDRHILW